jgi:hypothetical protein
MKTIEDNINLWLKWKSTTNYVAPYRIVAYHYAKYNVEKNLKPLFPDGEINDVFAVIARSKPAAIFSCNVGEQDEILTDAISVAGNSIYRNVITQHDEDIHVFSRSEQINNAIKQAISQRNTAKLGLLLGYPSISIKKYQQKIKNQLTKYGGIPPTKQYEYNKQYLHWFYRKEPEFQIPDNWFQQD